MFCLRFSTIAVVFLSTSAIFAAAQSTQDSGFWRISEEKAKCILSNIDAYISRPGSEIVLIPVDSCPSVDPFADALKGKKNQSSLMAEVTTDSDLNKTAKFISYPKSQLKCMKDLKLQLDGSGLALLPKSVTCD